MFNNKSILVTGGTGSFGKKFIKTILERFTPKKVIIYSRDESKQFDFMNDVVFLPYMDSLRFFIGDIRDLPRLKFAMENVDYVVHAVALKNIPLCEYNPFEAVKTNVYGAQNVIDASIACNVKKVLTISSDKAASPVNVYGATQLTSDKLFISANNYVGWHGSRFSVIRLGSLMKSSGSVLQSFLKMQKSGVISVTDKRMTRFNITLDESVEFALFAFENMLGGEIFVPKLPAFKVVDLVKAIDSKCEIKYTGIRLGEKIHEELLTSNEALWSFDMGSYFIILPNEEDNVVLNKIQQQENSSRCVYGFNYSSDKCKMLTVNELRKLIEEI